PVGDGVKRRAHDADLKEMVVIRSPSPQLVPFKLHRFGQQRRFSPVWLIALGKCEFLLIKGTFCVNKRTH
ncbi:hypothetical protein OB952_15565, partial [Aeromonas salmonicida]|uniref:hypothetical protein n=1 Tax=Aeromonas salmonicida TaxID=645 RepID=UPI00259DFC48